MVRSSTVDGQKTTGEYIKSVFLSLYREKPLHRIFVSELVSACNISRGTFYFHFENIEQLYRKCEEDLVRFMEDGLDSVVLCTVGGSRSNTGRFIQTYSAHLSRYPVRLEQFQCLLNGSENASFRKRWTQSVFRHFEKTLPFSNTVSPEYQEYLLHFFSGGEVAMLSNWILNGCTAPPEAIASISAQALFQGTFVTKTTGQ